MLVGLVRGVRVEGYYNYKYKLIDVCEAWFLRAERYLSSLKYPRAFHFLYPMADFSKER
jgi:hypothetical protein